MSEPVIKEAPCPFCNSRRVRVTEGLVDLMEGAYDLVECLRCHRRWVK